MLHISPEARAILAELPEDKRLILLLSYPQERCRAKYELRLLCNSLLLEIAELYFAGRSNRAQAFGIAMEATMSGYKPVRSVPSRDTRTLRDQVKHLIDLWPRDFPCGRTLEGRLNEAKSEVTRTIQ